MPPRGVKKGTKRARQYEHIKESERKQGRSVPDRCPPRREEDMSSVDVRERWRDSPLRARSLLTVRAAISSARLSLRP